MPWLRIGDETLTHPAMFKLLRACNGDIGLRNESYGALVLMASVSAQQCTDYVVDPGLVAMIAPGRFPKIMEVLEAAGLVSTVKDDEGYEMWKIAEIDELLHMRLKIEVDLDRRRKNDGRRPDLMIPVKIRDGDHCRWCGRTVKWGDQKSGRGATIDSLNGHVDSTVDTLVVACRKCNSKRGGGEELTLRPAPESPYYTQKSADFINASQWAQDHGVVVEASQTRLTFPSPAQKKGTQSSASPSACAATSAFESDADDAPDWVTGPVPTPEKDHATPMPGERPADPETTPAPTMSTAPDAKETTPEPQAVASSISAPKETTAPAPSLITIIPAGCSNPVRIEPGLTRDLDRKGDGSGFAGTGRGDINLNPLLPSQGRRILKGSVSSPWMFWVNTGEGKAHAE